tara:strand:+ start:509 stop:778 length:270 start_codon:yes stop_codon:yes gene_type:complete
MEKRTLTKMKKNIKKEETIKFPISGMLIISKIIENQNLLLLKKIADVKFLHQDDKEIFIEEYNKINYHIPDIVNKIQEEYQNELQKFIK